ncbi:MAG: family 20 glycosylhydrolase [Lentisphaerae bacterium]|nr:family 20 glycosylhydrolase [Lentisphaerota bacterium]
MKPVAGLPIRGVHLDCRAQMLRFERVREIFHDLVRWGYNAVLLEYEDHFPYRGRLKSIASADALTLQQVKELARLARALGLQIIPLVQCLGHLTYVLRLPAFRRLTEGYPRTLPYAVCPAEPKARTLFREMVAQVLAVHTESRYFHLGGDEVLLEPDCPRCRAQNPGAAISKRLVDHYLDRADWVRGRGPDPIVWGDLILAHPRQRERLRGRVTIMDWDYWSGTRPTPAPRLLWGMAKLPPAALKNPRAWPRVYRTLFPDSVFTAAGQAARPFPYAKFLHDEGLAFMLAAAARSGGDSFCAPRAALHADNVVGAIRTATERRALGCVITSWALRRAPWPLTEYALIAGSLALKHPRVPRRAIAEAFVREHFGVGDLRLARIPLLLGVQVPALLQTNARADVRTNQWLAQAFDKRLAASRHDRKNAERQLKTLKVNCIEAERLLRRARPRALRQRERVALWRWAIRVFGFYAAHAPRWLDGEKPSGSLSAMRPLIALTGRVLGRWYTNETLAEELQARFGSLADYLADRPAQEGTVSG